MRSDRTHGLCWSIIRSCASWSSMTPLNSGRTNGKTLVAEPMRQMLSCRALVQQPRGSTQSEAGNRRCDGMGGQGVRDWARPDSACRPHSRNPASTTASAEDQSVIPRHLRFKPHGEYRTRCPCQRIAVGGRRTSPNVREGCGGPCLDAWVAAAQPSAQGRARHLLRERLSCRHLSWAGSNGRPCGPIAR